MERGELIDNLVDRTNDLSEASQVFRRESREVSNQMWMKKYKTMALVGGVSVFVVYLLVGFGCGFPTFHSCLA